MQAEDCSFETARLSVADWHAQTEDPGGGASLAEIVRGMLSSEVTEQLPESWQGPYSEQRTLNWKLSRWQLKVPERGKKTWWLRGTRSG